jgi:hypothetical protein
VSVLVDNNTSIKGAITLRVASIPQEHSHTSRLAIRRRREHGVVGVSSILSHENNLVVALTTRTVVVSLEVTSLLIETENMEKVMVLVGSVEELSNGCVTVAGRVGCGWGVLILKGKRLGVGAVVVKVGATSRGVCLGDTVVAASRGVVGCTITLPSKLRSADIPGVLDNRARTLRRVVDAPRAVEIVSIAFIANKQ